MRFHETNSSIVTYPDGLQDGFYAYYAQCNAAECGWCGPVRQSVGSAKRDAVRHHAADA